MGLFDLAINPAVDSRDPDARFAQTAPSPERSHSRPASLRTHAVSDVTRRP